MNVIILQAIIPKVVTALGGVMRHSKWSLINRGVSGLDDLDRQ